jgi:hypothetical protein
VRTSPIPLIFLVAVLALEIASASKAELVAYYPMDEGSGRIVRDFSGLRHVGEAQADPAWVDGAPGFGKALYFDGNEPAPAWVDCGTWNPSEGTDELTAACWIRWGGLQSPDQRWHGIIGKRDGWDDTEPLMWFLEINGANGYLLFGRLNNYAVIIGGSVPAGEWTHIAATCDRITGSLYVNGELKKSAKFSLGPKTDSTLVIGADNLGGANAFYGAIDEVRLYNTAMAQEEIQAVMFEVGVKPEPALAPGPADRETDIARDVVLSWRPGIYAVTHNVYFGTDFNEVNEATVDDPRGVLVRRNQVDTTYDPEGLLEYGQTYYWRVDEVNDADLNSPWQGDVWSFTVRNFVLVEGFESYTDEQPNRVFDTWIDGWGTADNGAVVGYADPNWEANEHHIETLIVHSGRQSMPFFYDNDGKYSEAGMTLPDSLKDWTQDGVDSLAVWYRGYPACQGAFASLPGGVYEVTGAGADIWGNQDEFHFAYKEVASGNCTIVAKVESMDALHKDTKAGVMIRNSLDPGATNAALLLTPDPNKGLRLQTRTTANGATARGDTDMDPNALVPYWLKLTRTSGGLVRAYRSPDGVNWTQFTIKTVTMQFPIYIGLAVTSHVANTPATAEFSNVSFPDTAASVATEPWMDVDVGITSNDPEPMYVVLNDTAVVYNENPAATIGDTWTQWTIPLSMFAAKGVDLTNVTSLGIGVGNKGETTRPAGSGQLFIDDIRLYRPSPSQ